MMKSEKKIKNKMTGCVVVWVERSNPNGNIEDGGPRIFQDGHGWVSAVCLKRQIRDMLADHSSPLFKEILSKTDIPAESLDIFESFEKGFLNKSPKESIDAALALSDEEKLAKYIDMRLFGTTCLEEREDKTSKNESTRFLRTGCVHFDSLESIAPIEVIWAGLSKKAPLRDALAEKRQGDLAPEAVKIVRSGLYFGAFYISPAEAHKTDATAQDIELFLKLIPHMFIRKSAQRANVQVVSAVVAEHKGVLGSFKEHLFQDACRPGLVNPDVVPMSLSDYVIPTLPEIKKAMSELTVKEIKSLS